MLVTSRALRRLFRLLLGGGLLVLLALVVSNAWVLWRSRERTFSSTAEVPEREIGLVLGTSPTVGGRPNLFFEGRMDAAAGLFQAGKVRHLLLSGDNGTRGYDEPTAMKEALVARGVPEAALHLDFAGFRTLDSMVRARAVFGVQRMTIITDDFHLPRSLFLADAAGVEAIGFASKHIPFRFSAKTVVREACSRVAALLDVYILHRQPKFYGPKEEIQLTAQER